MSPFQKMTYLVHAPRIGYAPQVILKDLLNNDLPQNWLGWKPKSMKLNSQVGVSSHPQCKTLCTLLKIPTKTHIRHFWSVYH